MSSFENLCKPMEIGNLTVRNRFCVAPMSPGFYNVPSSEFVPDGIEYFVQRAKGGFGLIFTGAYSSDQEVDPINALSANPLNSPAEFRKTSLEMNRRIQAFGSHAFGQITLGVGRNYPGFYAPSETPVYAHPELSSPALTIDQIKIKIDYAAKVAKIMKDSGFSGVEVHALHWGYLLDEFAMSITNKRTDEYGGSLENRLRITKETLEAIKAECGKDFPVTIRLGIKSYIKSLEKASVTGEEEAGRTVEEAVRIAKLLEEYGYDALSVDTGVYESFYYACPPMYVKRGYAIDMAAEVKKAVSIPVLLGGRMGEPYLAEQALKDGKIDAMVLGRPSLADPDFPRKVEMGCPEKIRPCISCNQGCLHRLLSVGVDAYCAINPEVGRSAGDQISKALIKKNVLIVGGGVAGMEAARVAALRGHHVSLYEKSDQLGGNLIPAGSHDFKVEIKELNEWYQQELKELKVDIHMNTEMDVDKIKALKPDATILTVGSVPVMPEVPGINLPKTASCLEALNKDKRIGQKVVVVGGGLVGCEIALDYINQGKQVTIVEALNALMSTGESVPQPNKSMLLDMFEYHKTKVLTGYRLAEINETGALVTNVESGEQMTCEADTVVISVGFKSLPSMASKLHGIGMEVYEVGDGKRVGNILTAVWDSYEVARHI